jgi:hypothetical protein
MMLGLGDTTVTVQGRTLTVDANGNWVEPWYCALPGGSFFDATDCAPPTSGLLLAANNAANIGAAASAASAAAATAAMNATDAQAAAQDPCYGSNSPLTCAATGGIVGGNSACVIGTSQTNADGSLCCAAGGVCLTTWLLYGGLLFLGIVLLGAVKQ